ncbi:hypothetical protein Pd630_LPD07891 [Rhodococcus opacus PD630]|nr:hypothetical protein Pd630_LPD07891 [Rhodococcus opacus PD630]
MTPQHLDVIAQLPRTATPSAEGLDPRTPCEWLSDTDTD